MFWGLATDLLGTESYSPYSHDVVASAVSVVLLGLVYVRVRQRGGRLLPLVCGYLICAAALTMLFSTVALITLSEDDLGQSFGLFYVHALLLIPLVVWFARKASRFSLLHAFFLFVVIQDYPLGPVVRAIFDLRPLDTAGSVVSGVSVILVACVLAWLLGNFEWRGRVFRKRAVSALLGVHALFIGLHLLAPLALLGFGPEWARGLGLFFTLVLAVSFLLPPALIYLTRVRQPEPGGRPLP